MKKAILLLCVMQQVCSSACQGMWPGEEDNWSAAGTSCAETMAQTRDPDDRDAAFLAKMELLREIGGLHRITLSQGVEDDAAFNALLSNYTDTCQKAVKRTLSLMSPGDATLLACKQQVNRLRDNFGYAYPTEAALACMKDFIQGDSVLSAGCGSGFIESKLKKQSVDIVATDIEPPKVRYMDIVKQDAKSTMVSHPQRNVLLIACWNPTDSLDLSDFKGSKIISIGHQDVKDKAVGFIPDENIWEDVSYANPPALHTLCNDGEHDVYVYLYEKRQNPF